MGKSGFVVATVTAASGDAAWSMLAHHAKTPPSSDSAHVPSVPD